MHPMVAAFIGELEMETPKTQELIERIPNDKLEWKPHEKSFTLGQLAFHIANTPGGVTQMIQADTLDAKDMEFTSPQPESKQQILDALQENMSTFKNNIESFDDEALNTEWTFTKDGEVKFGAPKIGILRAIVCNHIYHHRGQLDVYLRLLDVPLPSVYGPSADENPFA